MSWLLRVYRNDGTESTIDKFANAQTAQGVADAYNSAYQTDEYRIEEYDPVKAESFWVDCKKVVDELLHKGRKP